MYGVANSVQLTPGRPRPKSHERLITPAFHLPFAYLRVLVPYIRTEYLSNQRAALSYLDVRARSHSGSFLPRLGTNDLLAFPRFD